MKKFTTQKEQLHTVQRQLQVAKQINDEFKKSQTDKQNLEKGHSGENKVVVKDEDLWYGEIIKLGSTLKSCAAVFNKTYSAEVSVVSFSLF